MSTSAVAPTRTAATPPPGAAQTGLLQRQCDCGQHTLGAAECDECSRKKLTLHQRGTGDPWMPSIVDEVLGTAGEPLPPEMRGRLEPRFGHDFSHVRVHSDAKAAQSAQAVSAPAYTVGDHVVFGAGQYRPASAEGKRLLVHELTHVAQPRSGSAAGLLSRAGESSEREAERNASIVDTPLPLTHRHRPSASIARQSTNTVTAPTGPNDCGLAQHQQIFPAVTTATQWLTTSVSALDAYIANPAAPAGGAVRAALTGHFHSTAPGVARQVKGRLAHILDDIGHRTNLRVECHTVPNDSECNIAAAYVHENLMVFCPNFFTQLAPTQAQMVIHESAHALTGGRHITDRAYSSFRLYPFLSTEEALTNAESYALFAQEIGTGTTPALTAPADTMTACPPDWAPLIQAAVGRAQAWNFDALNTLTNTSLLSDWTDLQRKYLGGTTPALIQAALAVYTATDTALGSAINIKCEPAGGAACTAPVFADASGLHVCPAWKLQGSEAERSTTMLAGIYDLLAGVHNAATRQNYAALARELHEKYSGLSHGHAKLGAGIGATILGLGGLVLGAWLGSTLSHGSGGYAALGGALGAVGGIAAGAKLGGLIGGAID